METVYTCICDGQEWVIFGDRIRCKCCGAEYEIKYDVSVKPGGFVSCTIEHPASFNERVRNV